MAKKPQKAPQFPLLNKMAHDIFYAIDAMSIEEKARLVQECRTVSQTNAWWVAYELAAIIRESAVFAVAEEQVKAAQDGGGECEG